MRECGCVAKPGFRSGSLPSTSPTLTMIHVNVQDLNLIPDFISESMGHQFQQCRL